MKIITYKCDFCGQEFTYNVSGGGQFPRILWLLGNMEACEECLHKAQKLMKQDRPSGFKRTVDMYAKDHGSKRRILKEIEEKDGVILEVHGDFPNFTVTIDPYEDRKPTTA